MRYRKHGTVLVATLLVAIMALSVFAMPVAAADVDEELEITVDADDVESSSASADGDLNITLSNGDDTIDDGDDEDLDVQINDSSTLGDIATEDDVQFNANSEEVDVVGENAENVSASLSVENAGDTLRINLDADNSEDYVPSDETIVVEDITIDVKNNDNDLHTQAGTYTDVAYVDSTSAYSTFGEDEDALTLTIEPGEAWDGELAIDDDELEYTDSTTVTVDEIVDEWGNDIEQQDDALQVAIENDDGHDYGPERTDNLDISGGDATATIDNISSASDGDTLNTVVGDFVVRAEQTDSTNFDSVGGDAEEELTIYPTVDLEFEHDNLDSTASSSGNDVGATLDLVGVEDSSNVDEFDLNIENAESSPGQIKFDNDDNGDVTISANDDETLSDIQTSDLANGHIAFTVDSADGIGEYELTVDAVPAVEEDASQDTETVTATGDIADIDDIEIYPELLGVVEDDGGTIHVANVTGFEDDESNTITNTDEDLTLEIEDSEYASSVSITIEDEGAVAEFDSVDLSTPSAFDSTTPTTEDAEFEVTADNGDGELTEDDDTLRTVHEVDEIDESDGWTGTSVPQPAELYTELDDGAEADFAQFNTTISTYDDDTGITEGELTAGLNLHNGLYALADDGDLRLGFDFNTDGTVSAGEVSMDEGWHLVSSNFDISDNTGDFGDEAEVQNDLAGTLDASSDLTDDWSASSGFWALNLNQNELYDSADKVEDYEAYWVYILDDGSEGDRTLFGSTYDPDDRENELSG